MKISYNTLKKYIPNIKSPEEVAEDLIMHTAEVEEIHYEWDNLKDVYIGKIISVSKHPDSEKLNICQVEICWETKQIVCWAANVAPWLIVPVAVVGAQLNEDFVICKTKIRWETSEWMICAEDEIGLIEEKQEWIMVLPNDAPLWVSMREYLWKNDCYLEVDNKAINHRPDLFSHIWIAREICAISWSTLDYDFESKDLSKLPDLGIKNMISHEVKRYLGVKASWVHKVESPDYIKEVIASHWIDSKRLLVDVTNYSLYLYGQPTHIFDADKINGNIHIRFAKDWETFIALNDSEYTLSDEDIVIADDNWVIALGWVIGWKQSAVSNDTSNIIIEAAHFNQATIRKTGKKLWLRTDALNVFEKDLQPEMDHYWVSLIISELEKAFPDFTLEAITDCYEVKQPKVTVEYDLDFINNLIWAEYSNTTVETILANLWITKKWNSLTIPFWRKDLTNKADIAEEIARIDWFDKIKTTPPLVNMWAVAQSTTYKIKNDTRNFFTAKGFYDMYNYSFVNEDLMNKVGWDCSSLVPMKNALSEEMTHLKWSLIPNLLNSLQENIRDKKDLNLFEIEKVFSLDWENISEHYECSCVITSESDIPYYDMQISVSDYLKALWIDNFYFDTPKNFPTYAHPWRVAKIIARWQEIWNVWEIHPEISKRFDVSSRVAFFSINVDSIEPMAYQTIKAHDISQFQMNNFDLNFVVDKWVSGRDIHTAILNADKKIIKKVELFDIYENEDKLPWKRSLSFKIYIQSNEWTLDDKVKNALIEIIVKKVEKKGGELR